MQAEAKPVAHGAVLFAGDAAVLAAFYARALDFRVLGRAPDHVLLQRDGFELVVHAAAVRDGGGQPSAGARRRSQAAFKPVFGVDDLHAARAVVVAAGGTLAPPEGEWVWRGMRLADGADPEGNVFQLRESIDPLAPHVSPEPALGYIAPVLMVAAIERALAFYCGALGFKREFVHRDFYAGIERDGCRLQLKLGTARLLRPDAAAGERVDACLGVRDAGTMASAFAAIGVEFAVPLREMPYGREFYLCDPDGNVLAFVEGTA